MYSLWEKQSFLSSDVIIIGAGITGLSAAASLKELDPSLNVTVLERGILPSGASTKNAGFACFGSVSELLNDINVLGEEGMVNLVMKRWDGLQKTCQRLGRSEIDLQVKSGYELIFEQESSVVSQIEKVNALLKDFFGNEVFKLTDDKISSFGFGEISHLIENTFEGQIDTGRMMSRLWEYCNQLGVKIHTGCTVDAIEDDGQGVAVKCGDFVFRSKKAAICTNAFTKQLPGNEELDLVPGRGVVLSIVPEKPLKFEGTFHYDEGYYYFRDYYGKLLYGGARNLALSEEETFEFGVNSVIKEKLIQDIENVIMPGKSYEVEMEWSGIMAFGANKSPIVKKTSDNVAMGVRLGGMGVAIGSLVGEEVAELIIES